MIHKKRKTKLNKMQKGIIKCLNQSGIYFIPFTLDGNWDYADNIKVIDINELTGVLKNNNGWDIEIGACRLEYAVYMLDIICLNNEIKQDLLKPFRRFEDHYLCTEIESNITLYLRYSDMLLIHQKGIYKHEIWKEIVKMG